MGNEPRGQDGPHRDEWDDLVLDENFVRGAEVSEPTARTRMLSERWKREAPAPQPWRADSPPAGWVHGGQAGRKAQQGRKPKKRRRGLRNWFRRRGNRGEGGED
ncbi:hypothetical protein [Streptomyces aidingensis]|uniref:Uncharacterized protein n=1 Tax=Streptomyces aidingensis TaxID=910347 RepID=A0A1I1N193_9ACTN|nr:hypothetical protein [Streptomyces aidingensis]SFC91106.1 hypothetical protein SAMN05421773_107170 [Streptomyces aidingensis]